MCATIVRERRARPLSCPTPASTSASATTPSYRRPATCASTPRTQLVTPTGVPDRHPVRLRRRSRGRSTRRRPEMLSDLWPARVVDVLEARRQHDELRGLARRARRTGSASCGAPTSTSRPSPVRSATTSRTRSPRSVMALADAERGPRRTPDPSRAPLGCSCATPCPGRSGCETMINELMDFAVRRRRPSRRSRSTLERVVADVLADLDGAHGPRRRSRSTTCRPCGATTSRCGPCSQNLRRQRREVRRSRRGPGDPGRGRRSGATGCGSCVADHGPRRPRGGAASRSSSRWCAVTTRGLRRRGTRHRPGDLPPDRRRRTAARSASDDSPRRRRGRSGSSCRSPSRPLSRGATCRAGRASAAARPWPSARCPGRPRSR